MSKIARSASRHTAAQWTERKETGRAVSRLAARTGFWSSALLIVLGIGYAAGLLLLMLVYRKEPFTTIQAYVAAFNTPQETVYTIVQVIAFLTAPVVVVWLACIHELTPPERKIFSRVGLLFGLAFAVLAMLNYFVQLAAVRQSIQAGQTAGLEWFLQWNGRSVMSAANLLAWFGFLGLAQLFVAPVFQGGRMETWTRGLLILTGLGELWGGLMAALNQTALALPGLLLLAFGVPVVTVLIALLFRRTAKL